ncbi:MAG TPA: dihydropteroate synthase [Planctomycetaceae bacterium]|nr:dihydropteroate synthase [Planctomycetaceae bacterium]
MLTGGHLPLDFQRPVRVWQVGERRLELGRLPLLMGILNVTPDSFSDGDRYTRIDAALAQADVLVSEGADILDIGGESTRPGADPVSLTDELARVVPVIRALASRVQVLISVDTSKAEVAHQAIDAGAHIINDVTGLADPEMPRVCAAAGVGVICMHMQGTPQTMQLAPHYEDVVTEIADYLSKRLADLEGQGIPRERVVLDPGIGFGKTAEHNLQILSNIERFRALGRPVLIGHSRKRFLAKMLGRPLNESTFGTVGVSLACAAQGADLLRLHEIAPTRDCLLAWQAVISRMPQGRSEPNPTDSAGEISS